MILEARNAQGVVVSRWKPVATFGPNLARHIQQNLAPSYVDGIVVPGLGIVRLADHADDKPNQMRWMQDGEFVSGDVYTLGRALPIQ